MKYIFLIALFTTSILNSAHAMGARRPKPSPVPTPPTQEGPAPLPTIDLGPILFERDYFVSASMVNPPIDELHHQLALVQPRVEINQDQIDQCSNTSEKIDTFGTQISFYTQKMFEDIPSKVSVIGDSYGVSTNDKNLFPTNLIRHPLCIVDANSLGTTIGQARVPSQAVIDKLNRFTKKANDLRSEAINGSINAKVELLDHWNRMFSCLAYVESLPSADSSTSNSVAKKYSPSNYRKPAGVEFYEDPAQNPESRLNIGIFQFTPSWQNNIQPCLRAWNEIHKDSPECQTPLKGTQADLIKIVGSSMQSFNAFCGVHKLVETFSIQVNTNRASATHPSNLISGKLKSPEQRCVSPHFLAGRAYNHFGPLQNSTRKNLDELFSCIEKSQN